MAGYFYERNGVKVMEIRTGKTPAVAAAVLAVLSPTANAYEAGDWLLRVGVGMVDPKSDNGEIASVDSGAAVVFNGTYMLSSTFGLELLAATPFTHDIELVDGGTKVGETKHLPPTVSLQYHFPTQGAFKPYAGLGLNYTVFFDEETRGPLDGMDLDLDDSFGIAAQLGFDYDINENMFFNIDARWINIETDAELNGEALETVEIDPLVYSLTVGWKF